VPECNNEPTLYGRLLTVTVVSENGGVDSAEWRETEYDPETERERWEAMQAVWRFGRGDDPDTRAQGIYDLRQGRRRRVRELLTAQAARAVKRFGVVKRFGANRISHRGHSTSIHPASPGRSFSRST
jgi:hypothetical protein